MRLMEADFWIDRWAKNKIGFHRSTPHPLLERHVHRWPTPGRILVPLSGKSLDLHYLVESGFSVVGEELVEDAVVQFFEEAKLTPMIDEISEFKVYRNEAGTVEYFVGDFFKLQSKYLAPCDGLYDRAALVALPPELRTAYCSQVAALLSESAQGLLVTLDYPPGSLSKGAQTGAKEGPPFSITPTEATALFEEAFEISVVEEGYRPEMTGSAANDPKQKHISEHALWLRRRG